MTSLLIFGLFTLGIIALVALPITLFNWIMKRNTGYDTKFHIRDDTSRKLDADFLVRPNDNRSTKRKSKLRKSQATPHYDRLHEMEQAERRAQQAEQRLTEIIADDDSEPIPLSELVQPSDDKQSW